MTTEELEWVNKIIRAGNRLDITCYNIGQGWTIDGRARDSCRESSIAWVEAVRSKPRGHDEVVRQKAANACMREPS